MFSLCAGLKQGITGVYIDDDGSLNPHGIAKPGYIIGTEDKIPPFVTNTVCVPMGEGTCAKYCTGDCLRIVKLALSAHDTKDSKVVIIDKSNPEKIVEIEGEVRGGNGRK